jgi:hypothetical protein
MYPEFSILLFVLYDRRMYVRIISESFFQFTMPPVSLESSTAQYFDLINFTEETDIHAESERLILRDTRARLPASQSEVSDIFSYRM